VQINKTGIKGNVKKETEDPQAAPLANHQIN